MCSVYRSKGAGMSVLGNVSIRLTEEQGMLLDVARGVVRDQAPIEAVRTQLETDTGYDAATWQAMVDICLLYTSPSPRDRG